MQVLEIKEAAIAAVRKKLKIDNTFAITKMQQSNMFNILDN